MIVHPDSLSGGNFVRVLTITHTKVIEMTPNKILLHSEIGAKPSLHQLEFLQQLIAADTEIHSQTLGRDEETQVRG